MKQLFFTFFVLSFLMMPAQNAIAGGIEFFHGSWEEALELATAEDKIIFVDAYTTWCGPCKRMAANVFTQDEVGEFFNANFVNMKIDMEKPEGIKFRQTYPVSAFPTFYFIAGDGKTVHQTKGAQPAENFIQLAKMVVNKFDRSADFAVAYDQGDRDPELILKYVKALNKSGKPSGKVANEYLSQQDDLDSEFNRRFILAATAEADSRIFDMLIERRESISALESKEAVDAAIESACVQTVKKAVEFQSEDLLEEAKAKMKQNLPDKAANFSNQADLAYYKSSGNASKYLKVCASHVKKEVKNNAKELHRIAKEIQGSFPGNTKALGAAEKYAKQAAEYGGLAVYYTTYANILFENNKKTEALVMAKKAVALAEGNPQEQSEAIKLIRIIEREG